MSGLARSIAGVPNFQRARSDAGGARLVRFQPMAGDDLVLHTTEHRLYALGVTGQPLRIRAEKWRQQLRRVAQRLGRLSHLVPPGGRRSRDVDASLEAP